MNRIELEDMDFYAFHGCYKEERIIGNHFTVSLMIDYSGDTAAQTDRIEDALNYVEAYELVRDIMAQPSNLLEHVAGRILERLFKQFSQIEGAG